MIRCVDIGIKPSLERMAESEENFRVQVRSMTYKPGAHPNLPCPSPCKSGTPSNLAEVRVHLMTLSETMVVKDRVRTWCRRVCDHGAQRS